MALFTKKMNDKRYIRAVSAVEYSLIVAVVVAALLGMQVYVKRAVSGRWRQAADTFGYGRQYDSKEMNIFGAEQPQSFIEKLNTLWNELKTWTEEKLTSLWEDIKAGWEVVKTWTEEKVTDLWYKIRFWR